MKKGLTALFLSLTMALTFMLCACGSPRTSDVKDFLYEAKDGEITITGYTGKDLEVVIPDTIDNRPVKYIGNNAFEGYDMTSVYVPEGVEMIHKYAFEDCNMLENIFLPTTLKCFYYENNSGEKRASSSEDALCTTKWYKEQPDGCLYCGTVLMGYKGDSDNLVGTLEVKDGTVSIFACAFGSSMNKTYYVDKVILPNSVKYIYDLAFSGFNKVESMDVPDGVIVGTNILGVDTSTKIKGDAYQIIDGIKFKYGEGGITRVE